MSRVAGASCLIALLGATALAAPGDDRAAPSFGYGNHAFRFILAARGLTAVSDLRELNDAAHSVVIILGDTQFLNDQFRVALGRFISEGGSVFVATDHPTSLLGVTVRGTHVQAFEEAQRYKGLRDCPVITAFDRRFRIFDNVEHLATNRPSFIVIQSSGYWRAATFPRGTDAADEVFAVAFRGEKQKLLVLADHSVFINSMMIQDDNHNFAFASNCVNWITDDGQRNRVLFLD